VHDAIEPASIEHDAGVGCAFAGRPWPGWNRLTTRKLREAGRLPYPMLRKKGARGFRRIPWDEAYRRMARKIRVTDPKRWAMFLTSRGITNEVYYMAQKVARFLGTNNVDNAARLCHAPSTAAMKYAIGVAATTCSYQDGLART